MSNEKFEQINSKRKSTIANNVTNSQNATKIEVFSPKTQSKPTSNASKSTTATKKPTATKTATNKTGNTKKKTKKKTAKRNSALHRFFGFLEKNFTPLTLTIITVLILMAVFLVGMICGFRIHKSLQKQSNAAQITDYIEAASKRYNVPYEIIYAVIETESSFDPNAVSSSGARGLMQIMPGATLEELNTQLGSNYSANDLFDPEINVNLGTFYLSHLYKRFGDYDTVFAAYNAGPTKVAVWLADSQYSNDGKTLIHENIPIEQTKRYVEKVNNFKNNYLAKQG